MRVVVTGASGFVGRALVGKLFARGIDVLGVSRKPLPGVIQVSDYAETPSGDVLVHLAEINDRRRANEGGQIYEKEASSLLDSLLAKRFQQVIYSSSAVLYGDESTKAHSTDDPVHPIDVYTKVKWECEKRTLNAGGVVARLVNLYGTGMSESNVLSSILRQARQEGPIRLVALSPVRDFLWIDDAAEALAAMVLRKSAGVFNVGTGKGTSILELAKQALGVMGQPDKAVEALQAQNRISHLVVSIEKTVTEFGWYPSVSLVQGIRTLTNIKGTL